MSLPRKVPEVPIDCKDVWDQVQTYFKVELVLFQHQREKLDDVVILNRLKVRNDEEVQKLINGLFENVKVVNELVEVTVFDFIVKSFIQMLK